MNHFSHLWHADCLNVVAILAMSQDSRKLKKLARQFGLTEEDSNPDAAEALMKLHECCHRNPDLVKVVARDLDERFHTTVARVRSMDVEKIRSIEMDWALPLLWAVLKDERNEVRAYGRKLVHSIFLNALRRIPAGRNQEGAILKINKELRDLNNRQKDEITELNAELRMKSTELENTKKSLQAAMAFREAPQDTEEKGKGRLTREIRKLRHELAGARERISHLEMTFGDSRSFPSQRADAISRSETSEEASTGCPFNSGWLEIEGGGQCAENHCSEENHCENCPLEGLRVAIIGGIARMQPEYRDVVRGLGAESLFHDGEVRNGAYKLKSIVCGADIVVFITSVNSHGALGVVKAVCRKTGKRFIALRETGVESLAKTLRQCAA